MNTSSTRPRIGDQIVTCQCGHRTRTCVRVDRGPWPTTATRSHTVAEATTDTAVVLRTARGLLAAAWPRIAADGLTLIGLSMSNLDSSDAVQLAIPFDCGGPALDSTMDSVRDRFGAAAVTRATLLGHDPGTSVPLLPD
ncbi:DinB/UmuC family translesion DNA polymerase [Actinokineospora sp. 24-640]